jgi:hypothetical protein
MHTQWEDKEEERSMSTIQQMAIITANTARSRFSEPPCKRATDGIPHLAASLSFGDLEVLL